MNKTNKLVFTQYLYIYDEVCIALLVSILNKKDDAIFWAYELYHSGFKNELFELIWKIYYDFFATINPAYEAYLFKKQKELLETNEEKIVSSIIQDLLYRPFNNDVFIIRNLCNNYELDITYHSTEETKDKMEINFNHWIKNNDFRSIAQWILNVNKNISAVEIYSIFLDNLESQKKNKLEKDFVISIKKNSHFIDVNVILLSKIMTLFSKKAELKKGKNFYVNVEPEEIVLYEPIIGSKDLRASRILEMATMYNIDEYKHLSLFKLTRHKYDLQKEYWYNWEYHASFSPLWSERIKQHGGHIDHDNKKVVFQEEPKDELMQSFYNKHGLEPDEQTSSIQNKNIPPIEKIHTYTWFYEQYKKNGLFSAYDEELCEIIITI